MGGVGGGVLAWHASGISYGLLLRASKLFVEKKERSEILVCMVFEREGECSVFIKTNI